MTKTYLFPTLRQHYPALDGLRGIAVLMILVHHFVAFSPSGSGVHSFLASWTPILWCGVDLFFVVSGFLITGILADHKSAPHYFRTFYARRILRIFPLYYLVLFLSFYVLPGLSFDPSVPSSDQLAFWTYTTNILFAHVHWNSTYLTHVWSLAIEEQFYMVWPLVLYFFNDLATLRKCLPYALAFLILGRLYLFLNHYSFSSLYLGTLTHSDGILFGAWLALRVRSKTSALTIRPTITKQLAVLVAALISMYLTQLPRDAASYQSLPLIQLAQATIMFTLLAGLFVWCLILTISETPNFFQHFCNRPELRWFGKYSYALYVLHVPVAVGILNILSRYQIVIPGPPTVREFIVMGLFSTVTLLLAIVSWRVIERPMLSLKKYFPYRLS